MYNVNISEDDSGLAPVIGIVLLVAITVLIASTAAVFVLGFGDSAESQKTPDIAFGFEYDPAATASGSDTLTVAHKTGEPVEAGNLAVVVEDATASAAGDDPNGRYDLTSFGSYGASSEITAGQSVTLEPGASNLPGSNIDFSTATVKVIWTGDGSSAELRTWTGQQA